MGCTYDECPEWNADCTKELDTAIEGCCELSCDDDHESRDSCVGSAYHDRGCNFNSVTGNWDYALWKGCTDRTCPVGTDCPEQSDEAKEIGIAIGVTIGVLVLIFLIILTCCFVRKRRIENKTRMISSKDLEKTEIGQNGLVVRMDSKPMLLDY